MPTKPDAPLESLKRLSRRMNWLTTAAAGLLVVAVAAALAVPEWTRELVRARLSEADITGPLSGPAQAAVAAVMLVPLAVLLYGLWQVRALFRGYAEGAVFTVAAATRLRRFALTIFAQAALGPLTTVGLSLALSIDRPPGQRFISLGISSDNLIALILGGLLMAVAAALAEACRIAEDNAGFV